jgi:hypothetical protein
VGVAAGVLKVKASGLETINFVTAELFVVLLVLGIDVLFDVVFLVLFEVDVFALILFDTPQLHIGF